MTAAVATPRLELTLPRVTGRHKNRQLAAARRVEAVRLRTQGWSFHQIADHLGYAGRGTVYNIIQTAQEQQTAEVVGTMRELELARLDALQSAVWDDAMNGDIKAVQAVLRTIDARIRLLGLASSCSEAAASSGLPVTVVVSRAEAEQTV